MSSSLLYCMLIHSFSRIYVIEFAVLYLFLHSFSRIYVIEFVVLYVASFLWQNTCHRACCAVFVALFL